MPKFLIKTTIFLSLFCAFSFAAFAQSATIQVKPFTGSKDFRKFSVGLNAGVLSPSVIIGGSNDYSNPQMTFGYGANIRYQFNHYFALQADVLAGTLQGNQNDSLGNGLSASSRPIYSFKTKLQYAASLNGQITIGNINWLSKKNTIVPYLSAGLGYTSYEPKIVKTGTNTLVPYDDKNPKTELFVPVGLGFRINLTNLINLDLGYRMNFVDGDNFDGYSYWTVAPTLSSTVKKDKFSYGYLGLEFAIGKKNKPKMLFDNPAARASSFLQSNINTLSTKVDSLAANQKGMEDTDGDGVADIFDKEPNTPTGSPVDAHGVSADTDGDGVPDFRDKQLITPTECQPVDADGVGKCPDPECCKSKTAGDLAMNCPTDYPSLSFKGNRSNLSNDATSMLATVAAKMKTKPDCNIVIKGYPEATKSSQANCQKRLDAIKLRLVEKEGISADRISTDCEVGGGDKNTVDISSN
jgi:opacity protein-like surface antigen/outer membrane protein OmpA-like peptidoglycan-associated protein